MRGRSGAGIGWWLPDQEVLSVVRWRFNRHLTTEIGAESGIPHLTWSVGCGCGASNGRKAPPNRVTAAQRRQ